MFSQLFSRLTRSTILSGAVDRIEFSTYIMTVKNKQILVLGGSGFIGSHVVDELFSRGADITVLNRSTSSKHNNLKKVHDKIEIIAMDMNSPDFIALVAHGSFDVVLHFAGTASVSRSVEQPYENFEADLHGTVRLLECLRCHSPKTRFIFTSSAAVYGNPVRLPMSETDPTFPISPYGVAKLSAERYCSVYSQLYQLHCASIRPFSIYGPKQKNLLVYDLIKKLNNNPHKLTMLGTGTESRDFIFIKDAVRSIVKILENGPLQGEVYNVATGTAHTTYQVARLIAKSLNVDPEFTYTETVRSGEPLNWSADVKKLKNVGFAPEYTLEEGINRTIEWYLEEFS